VSKDDPPSVVFFGSEDKLVPLKTPEDFQTRMRKAGVRCGAFVYADQGYGFFNRDPWATKTLIETDRFLESLGWLCGPPTLEGPDNSPSGEPPLQRPASSPREVGFSCSSLRTCSLSP